MSRSSEHGADAEDAWLLTVAVPGRSAVDPRWMADPAAAAAGIGRAFGDFTMLCRLTAAHSTEASTGG
jgi:aminoglycoside phosphotransferase